MCAAPQVLRKFHSDERIYQRMLAAGVRFSPTCCETIFESGQCTGKAVITNSNKLRAYTSARFFTDEELLQVMASGKVN
jgi:hypothetical protein